MAIAGRSARASFYRANREADGLGGWRLVAGQPWILLGEAWASVEDITERERLVTLQRHPYRMQRVTVGALDFTPETGQRLTYDGRNYRITNVARKGPRTRRTWEILAEEDV